MAIVTRVSRTAESRDDQGSINMETKVGLTKRFLNKVGLSDHIEEHEHEDVEMGVKKAMNGDGEKNEKEVEPASAIAPAKRSLLLGVPNTPLEQTMPSDAILSKEGAKKVCYFAMSFYVASTHDDIPQFFADMEQPFGIITLEDVIEGTSTYSHPDPCALLTD